MTDENAQQQLLEAMARLFKRFALEGDLGPLEERSEWEKLVDAQPPEQRELLEELAHFADLWRYLQEHNERLGPEIVDAISSIHRLPVSERMARVKEINQKLMERIVDAGESTQFRH